MACKHCTDPDDGSACFPMYGLGPHRHTHSTAGHIVVGGTVGLPADQWPTNYREDPECPGMGVWWCPHCGDGKPSTPDAAKQDALRIVGASGPLGDPDVIGKQEDGNGNET